MTVFVPRPSPSSPLSSIQGTVAYGDGNPNTTTTITYHFAEFLDTQSWTSEYKAEFRAALAAIEAVANIQFVEVANLDDADIAEMIAPTSFFESEFSLGFHQGPFSGTSYGAFNTDFWTTGLNGNGDPGGYFFTTLVHELGHALGLGHPHDTSLGTSVMAGVTSPFDSFGIGNLNQGVYTVMSYNDGWTQRDGYLPTDAVSGGSTGLGALDIAALQAMYGANTTTNSGINSYSLPSFNTSGVGYQAIWDTGGVDTIRHTGSAASHIDLRPATLSYSERGGGGVSYVDGVKGGFTIAAGVVIENASGGSGTDTIIGNTAENVINGNGGNDLIYSVSDGSNDNTINGGQGNDTIHLADGSGADTVNGNAGDDIALVVRNNGSFSGGAGTDTIRFDSSFSANLLTDAGTYYEFYNLFTHFTFSVSKDVEVFEFSNGLQQYGLEGLESATEITDVETTGTALRHSAQGVYLLSGTSAPVGVIFNGQLVGQNTMAGWSAVQAEASGAGYRVLWQHVDGSYHEWTLDSQGAATSGLDINNVIDLEVFYGSDINNDGEIGHFNTLIESYGSTELISSTRGMYLIDGSVEISLNGTVIGQNTMAGWSAVQAEASGAGYRVLWQHVDGSYHEWTLDSQGAATSGLDINNVIDLEVFYGSDINNDGEIGHFNTLIESYGSTELISSTRGMYLIDGSVEISLNGTVIGQNTMAGWSAVQAEASGAGYRVLWQHVDGSYHEWTLDSQGAATSGLDINNVIDLEVFYGSDINNDGEIGHFNTLIESYGSTELISSTRGMYLIDGSVEISLNGTVIGQNTMAGWSAVQAEASGAGYRVLWQHVDGSYHEWTLDSQGAATSGLDINNVIDLEVFYGSDINNDGEIGHFNTLIESYGSTELISSTRGMYLIDGSVEISLNGTVIGQNTMAGWSAVQAEASGAGYRVLWQHVDGSYHEWTLDSQGAATSGLDINNVIDLEVFYGGDIDGNGTVGHVLPKVSSPFIGSPKITADREDLDVLAWEEDFDALDFVFVEPVPAQSDGAVGSVELSDHEFARLLDIESASNRNAEEVPEIEDPTLTEVIGSNLPDEDFFLL